MNQPITRKGQTGEAGNPGEFGSRSRDESAVSLRRTPEQIADMIMRRSGNEPGSDSYTIALMTAREALTESAALQEPLPVAQQDLDDLAWDIVGGADARNGVGYERDQKLVLKGLRAGVKLARQSR